MPAPRSAAIPPSRERHRDRVPSPHGHAGEPRQIEPPQMETGIALRRALRVDDFDFPRGRIRKRLPMFLILAVIFALTPLHGVVRGGGVPVPGAAVIVSQGKTTVRTLTAGDGSYQFADLADGNWTVRVSMTGFETATQTVTVGADTPALDFTLRLAPYTGPPPGIGQPPAESSVPASPPDAAQAVIVNGSESNAAASPYAQPPAFGNFRPPLGSLFNGGFGLSFDTSALDARSFSFTGQNTAKPGANNLDMFAQLGGPLRIPYLTNANNAPEFFFGYQRQTARTAVT